MVLPKLIVDLTNDNKEHRHGITLHCLNLGCGGILHVSYTMVYCTKCKTNHIVEGARFCDHPGCNKLVGFTSYYAKAKESHAKVG